ncbi:MAG: hypothetical protein Q8936_00760 [Bacillota bacterium]|nr:hypothetical protein [Bacillota bacterium]
MNNIKITFFPNESEKGAELTDLIKKEFADFQVNNKKIELRIIENDRYDQFSMLQACLGDDIVIFDASVEDEQGLNYRAATAQASAMDHVFVVSRTKIPINFNGLRKGGYPELIKKSGQTIKNSFSNEEIMEWIKANINEMIDELPRPGDEKIWIPSMETIGNHVYEMNTISERIMLKSLDKYSIKDGIFISFLSAYSLKSAFPKTFKDKNVEDLVDFIDVERGKVKEKICYFPPGSISSEFMTEQRRWQVVSIIDRYIRKCSEFWVFETEDYYNSWWTLAELTCLAYMKATAPEECPDIYICSVQNNEFVYRKADEDFFRKLDEYSIHEIARFFSNSDPSTVGYESAQNMMIIKSMPESMQLECYNMMMQAFNSNMTSGLSMIDGLNDLTFERFRESLQSHVYDEGFWNEHIVTCPNCSKTNDKRHGFDIKTLLNSALAGMYIIDEETYNKALSVKKWQCPKCGHSFEIIKEDEENYIWWPVRAGRITGPNGTFVERQSIYSIKYSS